MDSKVVSVIIPVYNTAEYVERCIKSVANQTYKELEIIVVDDGSTDRSLEVCKSFQNRDERTIIFSQTNQGASVARNVGLDMATGDYIMFVDSDDWIEPDMVEKLLNAISVSNSDLVISIIPNVNNFFIEDKSLNSREALLHILKDRIWWSPCGKLFRSEILTTLRFPMATLSEDYWFMSELFLHELSIRYDGGSYYHRTIRSDSLSKSKLCGRRFEEIDNVLAVWEKIRVCVPEYEKYAERNLAETLLMLLLMIYNSTNVFYLFIEQEHRIISLIRSHYWSILCNTTIKKKQKLLLVGCFSPITARLIARLYLYTSRRLTISNRPKLHDISELEKNVTTAECYS